MVIVHAEHPQSHGQIHRQAAIATVGAQRGGQIVGQRAPIGRGHGQTAQQTGREQQRASPQSSHPAAMLGQQQKEAENRSGTMEMGGGGETHKTT